MNSQPKLATFFFVVVLLPLILACNDNESEPTAVSNRETVASEAQASQPKQSKTSDEDEPPILSASDVAEFNQLAQKFIENGSVRMPEVAPGVPGWLEQTDLPFDHRPYFDFAASENGGEHYIKALALADLRDSIYLMPDLMNELQAKPSADLKRFGELAKKFSDANYHLTDWLFEPENEKYKNYFDAQAPIYISRLDSITRHLRKAKTFPVVVVHRDFSMNSHFPFYAFRNLAQDYSILVAHSPNSDDAITAVELTLNAERDLRRLGDFGSQLTATSMLRYIVNYQIVPILRNADQPQRIARVINVLQDAHQSELDSPRFIELARFEHLQLCKLLHQLRNDTLDIDSESLETIGLENGDAPELIAHKLMTTDIMGGHAVNDEVALQLIDESLADQPAMIEKAKEVIASSRKSPLSGDASAALIGGRVVRLIQSMTPSDFEFEVEVLNKRYQEFEACRHLPFPHRIDRLQVLTRQWTLGETWKQTKFLKWYRPLRGYKMITPQANLLIDSALCHACVKLFQSKNDGRFPPNVETALEDAGVENSDSVIDPFSGTPLKMLVSEAGQFKIYSIGPDRMDNQGHPSVPVSEFSSNSKGDVVFELPSR